MVSQGAWIVALFVVLLGQRLPVGPILWAGLGIALYAGATIAVPHPSWPYLGGLLVLIAIGNVIRLTYRPGRRPKPEPVGQQAAPGQLDDGGGLIGTIAPVTKAIRGGFGMVMLHDDPWPVCCDDDVPEGRHVRIIGISGTYLMVSRTE